MRRKGISLGAAKSLEVRGCDAAGCGQSCGAWRGDGGGSPGQSVSGESGKLPNKLKGFLQPQGGRLSSL